MYILLEDGGLIGSTRLGGFQPVLWKKTEDGNAWKHSMFQMTKLVGGFNHFGLFTS